MTQDEIIRMAREAGAIQVDGKIAFYEDGLERFFNLAFAAGATHERAKELTDANISLYKLAEEAGFDVAQWAINGGKEVVIYEEGPITGELTRFAALVAAHEREAIAQIFDDAPNLIPSAQNNEGGCLICGFTPKIAAAAIRARGEK